jgi:hypothetical protein
MSFDHRTHNMTPDRLAKFLEICELLARRPHAN